MKGKTSPLTLGDRCAIVDCEHKTAPTQKNGIPLIRTPNIERGFLKFDGVYRVSDSTYDKWTRRTEPQALDLIMAREAPVGNVGIVPPDTKVCLGQRTVLIRVRDGETCPEFLNYLLSSAGMHAYLNVLSNGATVGHLNVTDIRELSLPEFPPRDTQEKVAAVLLSYDQLIDKNKSRIRLLEAMATELYREWFVRMRFPGHESADTDDWKLRPLSELVEMKPKETVDDTEFKPYVGMEDLSTTSMYFTSKARRLGKAGTKFQNGDVLFPRITPSVENGKRGFVMTLPKDTVAIGSTEFIVLRKRIIDAEHAYFLTCSADFRKHAELSMVGASGRQRVQEDCFDFFLVPTPTEALRKQFRSLISPFFDSILSLSKRNDLLSVNRDHLLDRLVSGRLNVESADIQFPPSMAVKETLNLENTEEELAHA